MIFISPNLSDLSRKSAIHRNLLNNYLFNTNLLFALSAQVPIVGTVREVFFIISLLKSMLFCSRKKLIFSLMDNSPSKSAVKIKRPNRYKVWRMHGLLRILLSNGLAVQYQYGYLGFNINDLRLFFRLQCLLSFFSFLIVFNQCVQFIHIYVRLQVNEDMVILIGDT